MRNAILLVLCFLGTSISPAPAEEPVKVRPSTPSSSKAGPVSTFQFGARWDMENRVTQGSRVGDLVFVAGQFSHDLEGKFVGEGDVAQQTRQTFANLDFVLAKLGASKQGILELEVFLIDPAKNTQGFVEEYKRYVGDGRLTVTLIGVTALAYPQELVEIRAVAHAAQSR